MYWCFFFFYTSYLLLPNAYRYTYSREPGSHSSRGILSRVPHLSGSTSVYALPTAVLQTLYHMYQYISFCFFPYSNPIYSVPLCLSCHIIHADKHILSYDLLHSVWHTAVIKVSGGVSQKKDPFLSLTRQKFGGDILLQSSMTSYMEFPDINKSMRNWRHIMSTSDIHSLWLLAGGTPTLLEKWARPLLGNKQNKHPHKDMVLLLCWQKLLLLLSYRAVQQ